MGAAAKKVGIPSSQEQAYLSQLRGAATPGTVRLAGNSPTAPQPPRKKDFEDYRKVKETIAAAKPAAAPTAPTPQGITMGPGTASRSF